MRRHFLPIPALAIAVLACAPRAEQGTATAQAAVDTAAVTGAVREMWAGFILADTAGNFDGLLDLYDENALVETPGFPPLAGRAAIDAALRPMFAQRDVQDLTVTPFTTVTVRNDLAYDAGAFVETYAESGKPAMTEYGRYTSGFRKDAGGRWRLAYIMAFPDSTVAKK